MNWEVFFTFSKKILNSAPSSLSFVRLLLVTRRTPSRPRRQDLTTNPQPEKYSGTTQPRKVPWSSLIERTVVKYCPPPHKKIIMQQTHKKNEAMSHNICKIPHKKCTNIKPQPYRNVIIWGRARGSDRLFMCLVLYIRFVYVILLACLIRCKKYIRFRRFTTY